jgi:hypothetical protein
MKLRNFVSALVASIAVFNLLLTEEVSGDTDLSNSRYFWNNYIQPELNYLFKYTRESCEEIGDYRYDEARVVSQN